MRSIADKFVSAMIILSLMIGLSLFGISDVLCRSGAGKIEIEQACQTDCCSEPVDHEIADQSPAGNNQTECSGCFDFGYDLIAYQVRLRNLDQDLQILTGLQSGRDLAANFEIARTDADTGLIANDLCMSRLHTNILATSVIQC